MEMPPSVRWLVLLLAFCVSLPLGGCKPKPDDDDLSFPDADKLGSDETFKKLMAYRYATRMAYNNRRFDELEARADSARSSKARFGNGSWKIGQFYDSLGCRAEEPESMWHLHDSIHKDWIAAKPNSITARVAQIVFLTEYAWHARGGGYNNTVTSEGWRLFGERLKAAHQLLVDSKETGTSCPVWWLTGMKIALGESWPRANYDHFCAQAKALEPTFWGYDTSRSNFLAIKWHGQPGEWEAAAEAAAADPQGLGTEIYARCVLEQFSNYRNVFKESRATWVKTQEGFELMRQRYPDSLEVASGYCRLACIAGDRATAKRLFGVLGNNAFSYLWGNPDNLRRDRAWAEGNG